MKVDDEMKRIIGSSNEEFTAFHGLFLETDKKEGFIRRKIRGLSGKYLAIPNISRTGRVALM